MATATVWGLPVALYTAALGFLSWNFFFIPPVNHFTISQPRDLVALVVFLGVASATGWLASRLRMEARGAQGRIDSLRRISGYTRRLGEPASEAELLAEIARLAGEIVAPALVLIGEGEDLNIRGAEPPSLDTMDDGSWAAARWSFSRREQAGRGTATLPSAAWRFLPLRTARAAMGVVGVRPAGGLDQPKLQSLLALADQAASALERVRLAADAARTQAQAETQKLRTALLNSLGHDLRTPLTGIRGAAGSLRTSWDTLAPADRADLLASIEQDIVRMTRFLANITEMTRVETGEIVPRLEAVAVADAMEGAAARVPGLGPVQMDAPYSLPMLSADPALLETVLVNILENAAKHAGAGSGVRVVGRAEGALVCVSITDGGPGISAADLPHVFDSFYRARREDRTVPGTGLGLAIARGLTEAMGGTIEALSPAAAPTQPGPGTTILLRLRTIL